jgi:hypothetical protein
MMRNALTRLILPICLLLQGCDGPISTQKLNGSLGVMDDGGLSEAAIRETIERNVTKMVVAEDFASLTKLVREFRTKRSLTPSGVWKLSYFYNFLSDYINSGNEPRDCQSMKVQQFFTKWAEHDPKEPAAYIANARALIGLAWCFRGNGPNSSLSEDSLDGFSMYINSAEETLKTHRDVSSTDPEYFPVMSEIQLYGEVDKETKRSLFDDALAREPYYYRHYFSEFQFLMPRNRGSYREMEAFALANTQMTHGKIGNSLYARLYWVAVESGATLSDTSVDWDLMKQGMDDISAQYPSDWNFIHFAKFSCQMNDMPEAVKYFKRFNITRSSLTLQDPQLGKCRAAAEPLIAGQ